MRFGKFILFPSGFLATKGNRYLQSLLNLHNESLTAHWLILMANISVIIKRKVIYLFVF